LCPYCGHRSANAHQCEQCKGLFDPLSRQASQNAMGPWFIRDPSNPFRPGCSFDTLRRLIQRGRVTADTIVRGPATRQFWAPAGSVPGVANLLGFCHACRAPADPDDAACRRCGAPFAPTTDREFLGLAAVQLLPGTASPEEIARASIAAGAAPPPAEVLRVRTEEMIAAAFTESPPDPPSLDAALVRLQRRLAHAAAWNWILAIAWALTAAMVALFAIGPRLGLHLVASGEAPGPLPSGRAGPPSAAPAIDRPATPPAQTMPGGSGQVGPIEAPVPATPPEANLPTVSPSDGSGRGSGPADAPAANGRLDPTADSTSGIGIRDLFVLISADTPESLGQAARLAGRAEPEIRTASPETISSYIRLRSAVLSVRTGL
jgi:hypothetical protein